jgi:transcriptional regulator with XRE-family HTH domain
MTGAILARRSLGHRLRRLREAAKMSQATAGRVVELSPQTIGRLEDGQATRISSLHIAALCDAYKVSVPERTTLLKLAREICETSKTARHWWSCYADLIPDGFGRRLALEGAARALTSFQNTLVPSLLRTPDYHRAIECAKQQGDSGRDIEGSVQLTVRRQERLYGNDFELCAYLLQSVLYHPIGGSEVMHRQLTYLDELGRLPNVSIRIIPGVAGGHIGLHLDRFVLVEFGAMSATGPIAAPIVYVDGFTTDRCMERDSDTEPYRRALVELDRVALDESSSRSLIKETASSYISSALPQNGIHQRRQGTS